MTSQPKRVYIGLPKHLADLILWVGRKYRTNPLSHKPGGGDVVVEYHDGRARGYDWIKDPSAYIEKSFARIVDCEVIYFMSLETAFQLEIAKRKIARVFARSYKSNDAYSTASYTEIWNSVTSNEMPWESLKRLECSIQEKDGFFDDYDYRSEVEDELTGIPDPRITDWETS